MAQDGEFQRHQVIGVHPVFGRLTDEGTLVPSSACIALHGMTAGAN
jgi:hypothetical protein